EHKNASEIEFRGIKAYKVVKGEGISSERHEPLDKGIGTNKGKYCLMASDPFVFFRGGQLDDIIPVAFTQDDGKILETDTK
ncbi:hypothetical protein HAX54_015249, partial [Datura stramonium]|nr:hypothetical protein [Datura stramonium]